jgi:signal transduction histidine kinase
MQPDVERVFVVSGASSGNRELAETARAQLQPFEDRVAVTYLSGLTTKDLEATLSSLPMHSIVYYLVVDVDGGGERFHPLEYLDRLSAVANRPIYSWVDSAMDRGIVGGSLKDQTIQMRALGRHPLRVLKGERADSIPASSSDLNVPQVDWRQLQRWGISEDLVPAGTLIRFRELSIWDEYWSYIVCAAVLLLAQTALITGLLVQRARRRRAETQLVTSRAELQASYERIHDLGGRLLHAQEAERARIARELHDDVGQQVALLTIDVELLAAQDDPDDLAREALTRVQTIARTIHTLSHRLHPAKLQLLGLVPALRSLQRELSRADVVITLTAENVPATLPADLTLCLFRVAQEAVQNALTHSGAHHVSMHLSGGPDGLALTVADDGAGFDVNDAWHRGLGLVSMRERVEAVGGSLDIQSKPGTGSTLEITVPLSARQSAPAAAEVWG